MRTTEEHHKAVKEEIARGAFGNPYGYTAAVLHTFMQKVDRIEAERDAALRRAEEAEAFL